MKKKDQSSQICVDYRKLNTVRKFDAYLMTQVDEMIDQVGKPCLAKGYWQVPGTSQNFGNQGNGMPKNKEGCKNHRILLKIFSKLCYSSRTID